MNSFLLPRSLSCLLSLISLLECLSGDAATATPGQPIVADLDVHAAAAGTATMTTLSQFTREGVDVDEEYATLASVDDTDRSDYRHHHEKVKRRKTQSCGELTTQFEQTVYVVLRHNKFMDMGVNEVLEKFRRALPVSFNDKTTHGFEECVQIDSVQVSRQLVIDPGYYTRACPSNRRELNDRFSSMGAFMENMIQITGKCNRCNSISVDSEQNNRRRRLTSAEQQAFEEDLRFELLATGEAVFSCIEKYGVELWAEKPCWGEFYGCPELDQ